jgi:hypothetical protein
MRLALVLALLFAVPRLAAADDGFPVTKISKVKTKGAHKTRAITKKLRAVADYLGRCKAADPALPNKHTIGFQIAADGTVSVISPDPAKEPGYCFNKALAQMTFPAQNGLSLVTFVATFVPTRSRKPPSDLDAMTEAAAQRYADMLTSDSDASTSGAIDRRPGAELSAEVPNRPTAVLGGGTRGRPVSRVAFRIDGGSTARSEIRDHLGSLAHDVDSCNYSDGDATKAGAIEIRLVIEASGATKATVNAISGVPQAVADCLELDKHRLGRFDFPALADTKAAAVEATLTFTFTP